MKPSSWKAGPVLVAIAFVALAIHFFQLTAQYAVNIFFWDQWDFNDASLFDHHSIWEIFRFQHGPHRQGLGGLLGALVEPWFHWNSRTEGFLIAGIVVVAGLCMLLLKYRLFGSIGWTDVVIPMLVFTPAQWESTWSTANLAHGVLPVTLILLYCMAWTWSSERSKYAAIVLLNFVTLYTGFGIFLGLLTPVLLLVQYVRDRRAGGENGRLLLGCLGLSIVSIASFFMGYKNDDASGCDSIFAATPLEYGRFLSLMFASTTGIRGIGWIATSVGGVVLAATSGVALFSWLRVLIGRAGERAPQIAVAVLSGYSLLFCLAATMGRTCTGMIDAHSSRYAIYKQLAILSLYFWALTLRHVRWREALTYALPVLLLPTLFVTPADANGMATFSKLKSGWRTCYLSGKSPDMCDDEDGAIYPWPERTHLQEKLDYLRATHQNLFSDAPEVRR